MYDYYSKHSCCSANVCVCVFVCLCVCVGGGVKHPDWYMANTSTNYASAAYCRSKGMAVNNLLLGGKVLGGTDGEAAKVGAWFFGTWTALLHLAKAGGVVSGQYVDPILAWNSICFFFSLKSAL